MPWQAFFSFLGLGNKLRNETIFSKKLDLEMDLAERVARHKASREKRMRSEDMMEELSEVQSDLSSAVNYPRSEASTVKFW